MRLFKLIVACIPLLLLTACASTGWWTKPEKGTFVGLSQGQDPQLRRQAAETDGRAKAAAYMQSLIQQEVTLWSQQAWKGGAQVPTTPSGARNDEAFTRSLTDQLVRGCYVVEYHFDERAGIEYVLMAIANPSELVGQVFDSNVGLLTDPVLLETGVLKEKARESLEQRLKEKAEELARARDVALKAIGSQNGGR
jgi:hypothetical protein